MATEALHPIDPNVKIPTAILAAGARADDIHKAIYQTTVTDAPAPDAPVTPPVTDAPAPADPPLVATPAPAPEPVSESQWEQRYQSMKGRYDKSQQQIENLTEELRNVRALIANMTPIAPAASARPSPDLNPIKLVTPQEETEWGPEFLDVVAKRAREISEPEIASLRQEVTNLKASVNGVGEFVNQSAHDRMRDYLTRNNPNWEVQNYEKPFLDWLRLPNPYTGGIRADELKAAWERNDGPRVLAFFNGFLTEEAATSPVPGQIEVNGAPAPKIDLAALAAPGRAKSAAAPAPTEKPVFTRAEIATFYHEKLQGKWKGREAEADARERQIFLADREGRIR